MVSINILREFYGKVVNQIRNEEMIKKTDALVAFGDGESQDTKEFIRLAIKHNLAMRTKHYSKTIVSDDDE